MRVMHLAFAAAIIGSGAFLSLRELRDQPAPPKIQQESASRPVPLIQPGEGPLPASGSAGADFERYLAMGTATASLDAYRLVADCRRSRQLGAASGAFPAPADKALREMLETERARLRHACDDVTPDMEQRRLSLLERAAAAGVRDAAVEFMNEGYMGDPLAALQRRDDADVQAWAARAVDYLKKASVNGDRNAIMTLAMLYDNENSLTGRQPAEALKYLTAAQATLGGPVRGADKVLVTRLLAQLKPEQAAAAQEAGRKLAQGREYYSNGAYLGSSRTAIHDR